jgi:hypothetical protein
MASIRSIGARLGTRLTYANVMSTLAFVIAFAGGTAYAAELVTSEDIVDGEVKNPDLATSAVTGTKVLSSSLSGSDIATGSLTSSDVADSTLTGSDVASNTLTGSDISESSLSTVPNATNVGGVTVKPFEFLASPNTAERTILSTGRGLKLNAVCDSDGDIDVWAITDRNARLITWSADAESMTVDNGLGVESMVAGIDHNLLYEDPGDQGGLTTYMTSGGDVVTIVWGADDNTSSSFGVRCAFVGTAFIH